MSNQENNQKPKDWAYSQLHEQVLLPIPKEKKRLAYSKWAETYDEEAEVSNYSGPANTIDRLLPSIREKLSTASDESDLLRILDAGCGTGLCGVYLHNIAGDFRSKLRIIGLDYSDEMRAIAEKTGAYDEVVPGDFDYAVEVRGGSVDFISATGLFCEDHTPVRDLVNIMHVLNIGGYASVTVRAKTYANKEEEYLKHIKLSGCEIIDNTVLPYTNDGSVLANYLLLKKTGKTQLQ